MGVLVSNWRDQILREFTPNVARLTLVADPDGLLLEGGVLEAIRARGFELIPFEDHVAFRYAYEAKFRSRWDRGEQTDLVVVLRSGTNDLDSLPYDLLQAGRRLSFNLGEIFPSLSYPVVAALDRSDLDALYEAQERHIPGVLGDNATKEFVLRHVFEIAPELIKKPSDLLRVLLRRHYREKLIPAVLSERFIRVLRQNDGFEDWPLDLIIPDRDAFFAFLQERWPVYLDRFAKQKDSGVCESQEAYGLEFRGPINLPFDHDDIRVYIDNLFVEGLLQSVSHAHGELFKDSWLSIGIRIDEKEDRTRRVDGLLDTIESSIPIEGTRHDDWFHFAKTWAELIALALVSNVDLPESARQKIATLQTRIDTAFTDWLSKRYAGLINLPPVPPVMLHHIPRFLAREVCGCQPCKAAFVLIDGLSLDQWVAIRKVLVEQRPELRFRDSAVFAWIPTITSVSRQAAFAGRPPVYFPDSIQTTVKEPALWSQFWVDQGLTIQEVAYAKRLGDGSLDIVKDLAANPRTKVVGLVVDKVDRIMHGMELGAPGMHNQICQWAGQAFLASLFDLLLDNGFQIYLTSDHGNTEASGCGRPSEGAVAEIRGERARVYSDHLLRSQVGSKFPEAIEWQSHGLPENYLPLLAPRRQAFIREAESVVCHGGLSLEEVIVPFVQVTRRDND